jgi:uncharacterized membrane protein
MSLIKHNMVNFTNSKKLSLYKSISWRVSGSMISFIIVYLISTDVKISISFSCYEFILKTVLYYVHDRAWNNLFNFKYK